MRRMVELIKLLIRSVWSIVRRCFARTNERRVVSLQHRRESYPSRISETSRVVSKDSEVVYLSVRVPLRTRCRYSVLFPGALSAYEHDYFLGQSWSRTFSDDRFVDDSEAFEGLFLCWSDEAYGTQDLFAHTWQIAKHLPPGLQEIHSDGTHLRAIIRSDRRTGASVDPKVVRDQLVDLARTVQRLPHTAKRRQTLHDRFPYRNWVWGIIVIGVWALLIGALLPKVHYVDSNAPIVVFCSIVVLIFALLGWYSRRPNWRHAAQVGCVRLLIVLSVLFAGYQRLMYVTRAGASWTEWTTAHSTPRYKKYTREVIGQELALVSMAGERDLMYVENSKLPKCSLEPGKKVRMRTYKDVLGLQFADSVQYVCIQPNGQEAPAEILN